MSGAPSIVVAFMDDHLTHGGSTVNLLRLLPKLRRHGLAPVVIASDSLNDIGHLFAGEGIPVRYYPYGNQRDLYDDRVMGAYRVLAEVSPQAVVASHETVSFDLLRYVPSGVFRVAAVRNDDEWSYAQIRDYAPWLDVVIGNTQLLCRRSRACRPEAPPKIVHIPNGVNPPATLPPRVSNDGILRVLYIGRLIEQQKRVSRFIPIWESLCRRDVPVVWTFLGDGPERASLERGMRSTSRQRVRFVGNVVPGQIADHCLHQDVVVLVSDYEGCTNGVLEAMACGVVPILTEQQGESPEMIDASCGFCVKPDDPEAFAHILAGLHPQSESFASLRQAAHGRIKNQFTHDMQVRTWADLIKADAAEKQPAWAAATPFLGPPSDVAAGRSGARLYYHPALRSLRRIAHRRVVSFMEWNKSRKGL